MINRPNQPNESIVSAFRILEYLEKNSDENHTVTQEELRSKIGDSIGSSTTYHKRIISLERALNTDIDSRRIIFDNGLDDIDDNVDDDFDDDKPLRIKGLYYNHIFSYEEIDRLIEAITLSSTTDSAASASIISKIKTNLTTKFYKGKYQNICKVYQPSLSDSQTLSNNLKTLATAIRDNVQVEFYFNGYNGDKELYHLRENKDKVNPYFIMTSHGRFYLLACREYGKDENLSMSIWRIDLMSDISIPNRVESVGIKGDSACDSRLVKNLPNNNAQELQNFGIEHMNMFYDAPERITIKINKGVDDDVNYTFIHDWFGDGFTVMSKGDDGDEISVICSPKAIQYWALQYCEKVEIIRPQWVRDEISDKIALLAKKYKKD